MAFSEQDIEQFRLVAETQVLLGPDDWYGGTVSLLEGQTLREIAEHSARMLAQHGQSIVGGFDSRLTPIKINLVKDDIKAAVIGCGWRFG